MTEAKERLDLQTCEDLFQTALHNQRYDFALQQIGRVATALENRNRRRKFQSGSRGAMQPIHRH